MNIKKIIKYILIVVPALFLAKCGVETVMYNTDLTPEINSNPTHMMKVHGNFPFEDEVKLDMAVLYITTNPICDKNNWLAGIRFPQRFMKSFPTSVKDGGFESDIYLDSYSSGFCKWQAYGVYILLHGTKDGIAGTNSSVGINENQTNDDLVLMSGNTQVGVIVYESFEEQGKTLDVECFRRKQFKWKGLPKEKVYTKYFCKYLGNISSPRDYNSNLKTNISSSQKEVEINFIDKGWKE
jgi:hypothetical protein